MSSTVVADLVDELVGLVLEGHAAEDHLGVGDRAAVLLGDRHDDDEDAVGGEHAPVAQRHVGHVADLDAVDEDHARLLGLGEAGAARVDVEWQAVVALEDVLGRRSPTASASCACRRRRLKSPWKGIT